MANQMVPVTPLSGGPQPDKYHWWPYDESFKPDYPFLVRRVAELLGQSDDTQVKENWRSLIFECIEIMKLRMQCSTCKGIHSMKGDSPARTQARNIWGFILWEWQGVGTSGVHAEDLRAMSTKAFAELEQALKSLENEYLKEAEITACRRAFEVMPVFHREWLPWMTTIGADRLR